MPTGAGPRIRMFVAMPGTTMGENAWNDIPEIKSNLLEPVADGISERIGREVELVIEKDKLSIEPIHRSMFREAYESDIYIADLTGANANVYLELGVRWALRDGVTIPIAQDVTAVKFNVSATRVIPYGSGPNVLRQAIAQIVEAAVHGINNPGRIDNPVRDGAPLVAIERSKLNQLTDQIERLRAERADDLVTAAKDAQPEAAIGLLEQALERNPHNFEAAFSLGVLLRKSGRNEDSAAKLRMALDTQPNSAEAWRELAVTLSLDGELEQAERAAHRSLELVPGNKETHSNLGGIYRRRARQLESAEQMVMLERARAEYAKAHGIDQNDTYPLINMALIDLWLLHGSTDADTTLAKLMLLTQLGIMNNPQDPWKRFDLSTTYALKGEAAEAEAAAREAIGLIPVAERNSYLSSAIAPLKDALSNTALAADQKQAIVAVLGVFESNLDGHD